MSDPTKPDYDPYWLEFADYATSETADEQWGTVHFDGKPIPVQGPVGFVQLATFEPRFSIGDPTMDSDKYLSVWNQSSWTGGGQIEDINESSDLQRFRHGTLETRYPRMLTLPPETITASITSPVGDAIPVGDYAPSVTTLFWAAFGTKLRYWDTTTKAFIGGANIAAAPVNKGVVFDNLLFIPQGGSGYDTWDGVTVTHSNTVLPVSFVEWDDKIVALQTTGQISIWDGATWDSPFAMKLRGNRIPRNLVVWWTPERIAAVFVVTNRDVWVADPLSQVLYRTGLRFPVHPDQGLGSAAWRDDAMYVSVGVGVHQLSMGGVVSAMGLDRDNGLPSDLRGAIVDLEPEYNGMLALVKGIGTVTIGSDATLADVLEETMIFDAAPIMPEASSQARSTLQRWTGQGWHTVWESTGATGNPTRVMVSEGDGEYRIWWGYGTSMYSQVLRRGFHNPKQGAELGIDRFAASGSIKTGRFDANMMMFRKLASHFECHLDPVSTQTMEVRYQTDRTYPIWTTLGTITGTGQQRLMFDLDGDGWHEGEAFRWIEFEYLFTSTNPLQTPVVMGVGLKFIKVPLQTRSWTIVVPLTFPEVWNGRGAREIADQLDDLASGETFFSFKHRDQTYRVRIAQSQGPEATGADLTGSRRVSLIEIDPTNGEQ